MTWEWLGSSVVALAGIAAGILAAYRQQQTSLAVVSQQTEVQVAVAREERQQRRIEEAYLDMLRALSSVQYWVFTVYPPMTETPEQFTMPPLPAPTDIASKEALWTAYWSPRVEQLWDQWQLEVRKLQMAGMTIGMGRATEAKGQRSGIDWLASMRELPELKQAVVNADKKVRHQVRLELRAESDGKAEDTPAVELAVDLAELADELAKELGPPEPSETAG